MTSSEWRRNRLVLITAKGRSKEEVHLGTRASVQMLKMTFSMETSRPRKTSTISSPALPNSREKKGRSKSAIDIKHRARMTFSEPRRRHQIKNLRPKEITSDKKNHFKGHNRLNSQIADIDNLITMRNGAISLNNQERVLMIIIEENIKNG